MFPIRVPGSADSLAPLVRRLFAGDLAAERALVIALAAPLRRLLARHCSSPADLDDIVQESLVLVLDSLPRYRWDSTVWTYASGIAINRCFSHRRTERRRLAREQRQVLLEQPLVTGPHQPDHDTQLVKRRNTVEELLRALPAAQAQALFLHAGLGHTVKEIAAESGVSVNTVRTRLRLGAEALRRMITTRGVSP